MFKYALLILLAAALPARADENAAQELQEFEAYADILPTDSFLPAQPVRRASKPRNIIPAISSAIPEAAAYNLSNAEKVLCYLVEKRPAGYTGHTLNSFAIKGYCGEMDAGQKITVYEALFTQSPNIITARADCRIEPRVMLRFVRGVDYADVLLSSPCPSFTVFYGGKYKAFNIKKGIIDDIISELEKSPAEFYSPAAQMVANGTAIADKEIDALNKKNEETAPLMKWKQPETDTAETPSSSVAPAAKKGWGNIKLKM